MPAPLAINAAVLVPATALRVSTARASGPGGQNVNKVSSKVDVRVDLTAIVGLDAGALARLQARVRTRVDADGWLQVVSQRTRDQAKNLADAMEKIRALVLAALVPPTPRRPTRPTRSAVRARLSGKKHRAARKSRRAVPDE